MRTAIVRKSARVPEVMNILAPLTTYSSPSHTARVRRPATSEPASGSVIANAAIFSPARTGATKRRFCSSVPKARIGGRAMAWIPRPAATPQEPPPTSSSQMAIWWKTSAAVPPYSSG